MFASRPLCYDGGVEGIGELAGRHRISVVRGCVQETTERPRSKSASWAPMRLKLLGNKRKQILRTWSVYRRVSDARALPALQTLLLSATFAVIYSSHSPLQHSPALAKWSPIWKL